MARPYHPAYPQNVNDVTGKSRRRFPSLQNTIIVLSGCRVRSASDTSQGSLGPSGASNDAECCTGSGSRIMPSDREIAARADPQLGQHFLVSGEKLAKLIAAAGIRPTDEILDVGAGIGTVARALPKSRSLTVVELDKRLIGFLRQNVPHAKVLQGDALEIIRSISFDVLIGNLPNAVTESLLVLMPSLSFRTAILAVGESTDLDKLGAAFSWSEVTRITGDDFLPPQPSVSRIVRVVAR